ncbi:MAG TPA: hypothetical protein VGM06_26580 [Polyangiaceae bacterium]|jgi:hypothetical protein
MKRSASIAAAVSLCAMAACTSTVENVSMTTPLKSTARWALLPVSNFAETPQAGERVEALLDTVVRRRGVASIEQYPPLKEDDTHLLVSDRQRYQESLSWARDQHFDYALGGSVEEWRYKGGLDGEPAVGVSVQVVEVATNRIVWSASGTRTGSGSDNLSGTALELLDTLIHDLPVQ